MYSVKIDTRISKETHDLLIKYMAVVDRNKSDAIRTLLKNALETERKLLNLKK